MLSQLSHTSARADMLGHSYANAAPTETWDSPTASMQAYNTCFGTGQTPHWQGLSCASRNPWESEMVSSRQSRVFSITDRQVFVPDEENPSSLYTLCRKWVQNDPESDDPPPAPQSQGSLPCSKSRSELSAISRTASSRQSTWLQGLHQNCW